MRFFLSTGSGPLFLSCRLAASLGAVLLAGPVARAQAPASTASTAVAIQPAMIQPGSALLIDIDAKSPLLGVDYSPDGKRVVACGLGHSVVVYELATHQPVLTLKGHTDDVVAVKYSPNGRYIASGGVDHALILWDALTGELLRKNIEHTDYVRDVAFSPDSKLLATAGWDGQSLVFDTFSGQRVAALKEPKLADASAANAAYNPTKTTQGRSNAITSVAFNPAGTELLTASGDHTLRVWNTTTWDQKNVLNGHADEVWDGRYSPNGRYVVSGAWDNTARVWELRTQQCTQVLAAHVSDVWATTFSPDGQLIATGGGDRKVKIWDAVTGLLVADLSGDLHTAEIENLAFSPNGHSLVSVSRDGHLKLWRIPGTADRVGAYARYNYEKWARKGEFEKTVDFEARTSHKLERVQAFQQQGMAQMLAAYAATGSWQGFTLKEYNADNESFVVMSSAFPTTAYRVKVAPKEAEQFRANFGRGTYGAPVFEVTDSAIALGNVSVNVAQGAASRQYVIQH
ncbi:WD40 repeat domain-containing protein [Hymenobacter sp. H14-R3]|uniref:WD40 repeat domain-containing protein n=1 Tax=Hymenobacter sp. H14-R3 TaxID=3046308 RepID=UPI0024B90D63|nr:WD40 repeat domain-containing protein [Hymenobacter sp. H14-R3]MDJ0364680.1 WD40 repeat domain-containing protein [Hymenobacter sp. H14-R3]